MSWNYRIVKFTAEQDEPYAIQEVYYNDDGKPYECCNITICGESALDIADVIALIAACVEKPILNFPEDFERGNEHD